MDSGNLAAALTACAAGFAAHGAPALAKRAGEIAAAMDFRALYDEKRRLFRIGLLPGESAPAQSWYDLLESEERLTAYFTIASGQIEHRHWRAAQPRAGGLSEAARHGKLVGQPF